MSSAEIDAYLQGLPEPQRSTLAAVRGSILAHLPEAEEVISYGLPGFRVGRRMVAGFAAHAQHCSYYPHSGSVLASLGGLLGDYRGTKSALHFPHDQPLPSALVEALLDERLRQAGLLPG